MSLINEMLTDLETRRGGQINNATDALDGVYPVNGGAAPPQRSESSARLLIAVIVGAMAACAAWFVLGTVESRSLTHQIRTQPAMSIQAETVVMSAPAQHATEQSTTSDAARTEVSVDESVSSNPDWMLEPTAATQIRSPRSDPGISTTSERTRSH